MSLLIGTLQRIAHATESDALDGDEFVNSVLAAFATESTLLNTSEAILLLVYNSSNLILEFWWSGKLTEKQGH